MRVSDEQLTRLTSLEASGNWTQDAELKHGLALDLADARQRIAELEAVLECDRTLVADTVTDLKAKLTGWHWLTEGRGSYEWDDDRYREEFRVAAQSFLEAIKPLEKVAADWTNSPKTAAEVAQARRNSNERIAELEAEIKALREKKVEPLCTDPTKYYVYSIRDAKAGFAGGSIVWWKANGQGYARDLKAAGVYTLDDYLRNYPARELCIYVPCNIAVGAAYKSETLVWEKNIPSRKNLRAAIAKAAKAAPDAKGGE